MPLGMFFQHTNATHMKYFYHLSLHSMLGKAPLLHDTIRLSRYGDEWTGKDGSVPCWHLLHLYFLYAGRPALNGLSPHLHQSPLQCGSSQFKAFLRNFLIWVVLLQLWVAICRHPKSTLGLPTGQLHPFCFTL